MNPPLPRVWTARTIVIYGLFFSPVFGCLLEAWNWRKIDRAQRNLSLLWAVGSAGVLFGTLAIPALDFWGADVVISLGAFFVWVIVRARYHGYRLHQQAGDDVILRSGWSPLPWAFLWIAVLFAIAFLTVDDTAMEFEPGPNLSQTASKLTCPL